MLSNLTKLAKYLEDNNKISELYVLRNLVKVADDLEDKFSQNTKQFIIKYIRDKILELSPLEISKMSIEFGVPNMMNELKSLEQWMEEKGIDIPTDEELNQALLEIRTRQADNILAIAITKRIPMQKKLEIITQDFLQYYGDMIGQYNSSDSKESFAKFLLANDPRVKSNQPKDRAFIQMINNFPELAEYLENIINIDVDWRPEESLPEDYYAF